MTLRTLFFNFILLWSFCFPAFAQTDSLHKVSLNAYIVPATLMAGGLLTQGKISRDFQANVQKTYPNFDSRLDDYLQYGISAIPLGMSIVGIEGKHKLKDQIILTVLSHGLAQTITQTLKYTVAYPRPDGIGNESFPSGHTTAAFTGAALMSKEYGSNSIGYTVVGYGLATTVGAYRILKNRHWLSDVLFSAGVGIAATETVYLLYPWLQRKVFKNSSVVALPTYNSGAVCLLFVKTW